MGKRLMLDLFSAGLVLNYQKADDKISVCKFSKKFKPKRYHMENSKTRDQIVKI